MVGSSEFEGVDPVGCELSYRGYNIREEGVSFVASPVIEDDVPFEIESQNVSVLTDMIDQLWTATSKVVDVVHQPKLPPWFQGWIDGGCQGRIAIS